MNIIDRLNERFRRRAEDDEVQAAVNRQTRRRRGFRGPALTGLTAHTFVPRYIRRHSAAVMAIPFTWRTKPSRRERKIVARCNRLIVSHGLPVTLLDCV